MPIFSVFSPHSDALGNHADTRCTPAEYGARMIDPASMSPARWQSRLAALKRNGAAENDPLILECHTALAYWRCRRVIDAERGHLDPRHVPALADMLRHAHPAVSA